MNFQTASKRKGRWSSRKVRKGFLRVLCVLSLRPLRLKNAFADLNVTRSQRLDERGGGDASLLRHGSLLRRLPAGHRLRDYRGGEGGRALHCGEAGARVEAVNDVVAQTRRARLRAQTRRAL